MNWHTSIDIDMGMKFIEGSFEVELPTYGQMQQQWWEQSEKKRDRRERERESDKRQSAERRSKGAKR